MYARLLALLALLALASCNMRPLGTNDVALGYQTTGAPPANLPSLIRARLAAAQITANVEATAEGATVSVDRDGSGTVDALLTWRGGLAVYTVATEATEEGSGVKSLTRRGVDGRSRTMLVHDPPRVDLSDAIASAVADGRTLVVRLSPYGETILDQARRALGDAPVAIARGGTLLHVGPLGEAPLVLSFGDDLAAYATARTMAALLSSPPLPALTRTSALALPADWPLATLAVVVPFVLSIAWLFFVRRFDRAQPEPWWLVLATFALGCLSVIPAALAELGWMRASEWLDPSLVTMGGRLLSLPLALPVFALVIGLSEEGSKFLATWSLAFHRREFDEPIDGIVYGAASSLGFAAVENVKYFALGRMTPSLVVVRMFMSVPAHLFFGAIWGYALGRTLTSPKTRILGYLLMAALAHGAFDTFLSYRGLTSLAFALNLGMATLFVILLRSALRHGVVTRAAKLVDPNRRSLYAVGSPAGFLASAVALHLLAALVFVASASAVGELRRVGPLFVLAMSSLVTLLGVAAYFLSATMPLDVVIDDYGVTFAGAARAWHTIRSLHPSPRGLHVRSTEGDVWIGPGARADLLPIARAISHRLGSTRIAA